MCVMMTASFPGFHTTKQQVRGSLGMRHSHSLIPRPSHRPVFDRLQYAKTEGEGLVHFITGGVPDRISLHECSKFQHLGQKLQDKAQACFFDQEPLPPSVYLGRQNVIHVIKWTRPSPSVFTYCKRSKTGRWGRGQHSHRTHGHTHRVQDACACLAVIGR